MVETQQNTKWNLHSSIFLEACQHYLPWNSQNNLPRSMTNPGALRNNLHFSKLRHLGWWIQDYGLGPTLLCKVWKMYYLFSIHKVVIFKCDTIVKFLNFTLEEVETAVSLITRKRTSKNYQVIEKSPPLESTKPLENSSSYGTMSTRCRRYE